MSLCGPSSQEIGVENQTQGLADTLMADFNTRFSQQSQLLQSLNASLQPIVTAGPEQMGFSAEELAARNTQAINAAGAASRNAQQAVATTFAGRGGGGDTGLESGMEAAVKGDIAARAASQLATAQEQITEENYAAGRQNYRTALAGAQALAGEYNPQSFASSAGSELGATFGEANKINEQRNAVAADIFGAGTGILKAGLGFATGGISNVLSGGRQAGSETGGGVEQFFSGGIDALAGQG